jgi:hypothetical protein
VLAPLFLEKAIEALDLGEESRLRKVAIEHTHGVLGIDGGDQAVARVVDGLEMAGRDVPGRTDESEVFQSRILSFT